ncbi:XRE family transcriptional regulator [Lactococcus kimchii]|uniref:XRE family transcriptional regulator n=1 Tax=Lactococcus sp. S-13 TaxID=2507158 RepID=UPI001023AE72|nr:helix-turn-helix domain-containing protein [Lactococcus sp. S-13]RZI47846.1 XRE family transcriptional regulator [Lactococcus sp. S-13]
MNFSTRLRELRKKKGLTQSELAKKLNVTYRAIQKYESGEGKPRNTNLVALAKIFDVSVSYLLGETNVNPKFSIAEVMEELNEQRQEKTYKFAKKQLTEQNEENKIVQLSNSLIPYEVEEEQALSAGMGEAYTDEVSKEIVYWNKQVKHDRSVVIRGNSMEPDYHYGDVALICYQDSVDVPGGIYAVDDIERGLAYIKSVFVEDKYIRLVSLNDSEDIEGNRLFPDILLPRNENTRIIGKVVEAFTPIKKEY